MKRRTLLQWLAAIPAILPFQPLRVFAQPRDLTPDAVAMLRDIAPTVLPASLGAVRIGATVDRFIAWTRGYREGVALNHGYGHPRLQRSGASPVRGSCSPRPAPSRTSRRARSSRGALRYGPRRRRWRSCPRPDGSRRSRRRAARPWARPSGSGGAAREISVP